MYDLQITPGAEGDIAKLGQRIPKQDFERLRRAIMNLAEEPRPHGVKKIRGTERAVFRIRVGNYRVIYNVYDKDNQVRIVEVVRRTETTYRA